MAWSEENYKKWRQSLNGERMKLRQVMVLTVENLIFWTHY